ncbi:MAG: hypothetical protein A2V90_04830 [Gammaproteobacteria bacterium RBG_16_57_12]|nr:MAG: hypothetical protein A2V90_04830 [Gammaproteobacteria bacterium RBG_16_57_12]
MMPNTVFRKIVSLCLGLLLLAAPLHGAFAGMQQMLHPAAGMQVTTDSLGYADEAGCQAQAADNSSPSCAHLDSSSCDIAGHCCLAFAASHDLAVVPAAHDRYLPTTVPLVYIHADPLAEPPRSLQL